MQGTISNQKLAVRAPLGWRCLVLTLISGRRGVIVSLTKLMKDDDGKYIAVNEFVELIANQTNDHPDIVIEYLVKYSFAKGNDIAIYLKGFFNEYSSEWTLSELLANDTEKDLRPYTLSELKAESDFIRSYFLKKEIFNAKYIKALKLNYDILNLPRIDTEQQRLVSTAPSPPNHIKASSPFKQKTIGDLIEPVKSTEAIFPNDFQRITMLYAYFTPHQASCLIAGLHPNFDGSNDDLEIAQGLIKSGLKKGKIKLDDEGEIDAYDLQLYLAKLGWVLEGFNVSLSLEQPTQVTELQKRIDKLENKLSQAQESKPKVAVVPFGKRVDFISKDLPQSERIKRSYELCSDNISFYEDTHPVNTPDEMIKRIQGLLKVIRDKESKISELEQQTNTPNNAQGKIDELENQLAQAKAELLNKPANDDRELNTKSQNYAAKIVLAMAQIADLSLDSPYASKEPNTTNSIIFDQIKINGMKVSNQVIGNWLKLATEQTKDD